MRFSVLDRVFVVILVVAMVAAAGFAVIVALNPISFGQLGACLNNQLLWVCVAALVLLGIGIRLVYCACVPAEAEAKSAKSITLSQGESGSVTVTMATMNAIVERTVQAIDGVQTAKPSFQHKEDGLYLRIQTVLDEQVVIPAKGEEIRAGVTQALMELTGVSLKQIDIMAEHAAASAKK